MQTRAYVTRSGSVLDAPAFQIEATTEQVLQMGDYWQYLGLN